MTRSGGNILAIDAGQSGIRLMHVGSQESTIRDFAGIRTDLPLLPQLMRVVEEFCAQTLLPVETVAAGVSGLTALESRADTLLAGVRHRGVTAVYLAHDSITGYLGSLGHRTGAVVAAGTGVVTLGVGPAGLARVDGWGHIIGDAGSGYWIGRAALEAGMRDHDGRGPATTLSALLHENFSSPEVAYIELQTNPDRVKLIASFATQVATRAESDGVAAEIIRGAGHELALSVATALTRAGLLAVGETSRVSWAGALLAGTRLRQEFAKALANLVPNVQIARPVGLPLDGVSLLPELANDNPLRSAIHIAVWPPSTQP